MTSKLLITKNKFSSDTTVRIAEGKAILEQYTEGGDKEIFRKLYRAFEQWSKNNHAWLGHIFSGESNQYIRDYENAGAWDTDKLMAARHMRPDSLEYKSKFFQQTINSKIECLEDLLATSDFLDIQQQPVEQATQLSTFMNSEEVTKKQAQNAVKEADRFGVHLGIDRYIKPILEWSLRLRKLELKALFFEETIRQIKERLEEHRSICKKGPDCPTDKKYQEVLFYLQQELDELPIHNPPSPEENLSTQSANQMSALNAEVEKIFISHSSKDASVVEEIIDLLEIIGIKPKQIFCSSFEGYSIGLGQDFLQRIKDELNGNVLVLFVITSNFYSSPVSLCEMGAAWVKTNKHIPIVVPPLSYEDVKGVIPLTQGFKINETLKWNTLKEQLEQWFAIQHATSSSVWERKRDKAIQAIDSKIQQPTPPLQRAKVRDLSQRGPTTI